jgi:hypothetical protein
MDAKYTLLWNPRGRLTSPNYWKSSFSSRPQPNKTPHPMKPRFAFARIVFPLALISLASSAFAADASFSAIQYTNLGWNNNSIWTPAAFPGVKGPATGNTDTATFANEGSHLITLPSTGGLVNIGNVVFDTPGATPNTYIFNSNSLLLSAGGAITTNATFTGRAAFNNATTLRATVPSSATEPPAPRWCSTGLRR